MYCLDSYLEASELISNAEWLLIVAGPGMAYDSGYDEEFYQFPETWDEFYDRWKLAKFLSPHRGYISLEMLRQRLINPDQIFVVTSTTDEYFFELGFNSNQILEVSGSYAFLQCSDDDCSAIFSHTGWEYKSDVKRSISCPSCGEAAITHLSATEDSHEFSSVRKTNQENNFLNWKNRYHQTGYDEFGDMNQNLVVIEIGADLSLRVLSEEMPAEIIRINSKAIEGPDNVISVKDRAVKALQILEFLQLNKPLVNQFC